MASERVQDDTETKGAREIVEVHPQGIPTGQEVEQKGVGEHVAI